MKFSSLAVAAVLGLAAFGGCSADKPAAKDDTKNAAADDKEAKIAAALAKLPDEDRREAEAQKFCAVANTNRLGSMDVPYKIMLEGQPVFLCCSGCEEEAKKDPKATLAKVAELKKANAQK